MSSMKTWTRLTHYHGSQVKCKSGRLRTLEPVYRKSTKVLKHKGIPRSKYSPGYRDEKINEKEQKDLVLSPENIY